MRDSKRDTDIKNSLVGEDKSGMISEGSVETYILSYVKQIANGKLLYSTGRSTKYSVTS